MTDPAGESILITGGCGFIGHHLALALKARGAEVTVFDAFRFDLKLPLYRRFIDTRFERLGRAGIPVIEGDTTDPAAVDELLLKVKPVRIVHLAAIPSAAVCDRESDLGYEINLHATQKMLEHVRTLKNFRQFVFGSSSMVYGNFESASVTEESPTRPLGIYGAGKMAGEHLVKAYHNVFGIPFTIVRPSALYGPTCINRRVGQLFIEAAAQGKELTIEGGGEDSLDFTYIDDLIQGLLLILTREAALNETFNMTYGESRRIIDLVALVRGRYPDIAVRNKLWERNVPHRGTLDISKARKLLGYAPVNPLETGFPLYMDWYEEIGFAAGMQAGGDAPR